ncbi:MAG: hypothetical protein WCP79_15690, partial [Bacillota bacterium]
TIIVIILAGATNLLSSGLNAGKYNLSMGHIMAPGRIAANTLADKLRIDAVSITSPALGANASQLTYNDSSGNVFVISYNSTAHSIVITKNGSADTGSPLAAGLVASLKFTRDNVDVRSIVVDIGFNDNAYSGSPTRTISMTVIMMNVTS